MITDLTIAYITDDVEACTSLSDSKCRIIRTAFDEVLNELPGSFSLRLRAFDPSLFPEINPRIGSVLFIDSLENKIITRWNPRNFTKEELKAVILKLSEVELDDTGEYQTEDGSIIPSIFPGGGSGFGFGLLQIPGWLKLLILLYGAKKAKEIYDKNFKKR